MAQTIDIAYSCMGKQKKQYVQLVGCAHSSNETVVEKIPLFTDSPCFAPSVRGCEKYSAGRVHFMSHNNGLCDINRQDQAVQGGEMGGYPMESMSHNPMRARGGGYPTVGAPGYPLCAAFQILRANRKCIGETNDNEL